MELRIENLSKTYPNGTKAVQDVSLTIPQGIREVVGRRLNNLSEQCNRVLAISSGEMGWVSGVSWGSPLTTATSV